MQLDRWLLFNQGFRTVDRFSMSRLWDSVTFSLEVKSLSADLCHKVILVCYFLIYVLHFDLYVFPFDLYVFVLNYMFFLLIYMFSSWSICWRLFDLCVAFWSMFFFLIYMFSSWSTFLITSKFRPQLAQLFLTLMTLINVLGVLFSTFLIYFQKYITSKKWLVIFIEIFLIIWKYVW